ncbi:MAG: DUF2281 domain-containing protein [Leptolyngbyaceae cyanobacterium RM2_2_4]|nr:DUF2281 domain-containing protein [Leptolyngbyaceae cyanobacterium SM1_4_3]NJN90304.1 DUF2281 domain-containing protein [Leptolyngbyaceae cyanobacterium SL_5_14]NJO52842.1 DUF2281 domain-containing protein [Leptolyngbyaceae cyanobacterium RM2_2_4]
MSIAEQIYKLVKSLPPDEASEVLSFAESIRAKHLTTSEPTDTTVQNAWVELVESLAGSWGEDFPTLEDIRAIPGQDILRESF